MFNWLFGRKRREEEDFFLSIVKAAAEGDSLRKLHQALATISHETLEGDPTNKASIAAAELTRALAKRHFAVFG